MLNVLDDISCAAFMIDDKIPELVSKIVLILEIGIPVILVIYGMIDLGKAVMSNDEKEMKGAQSKLIRRLIYAALVFFVFVIVKVVIGLVATDNEGIMDCVEKFIRGPHITENGSNGSKKLDN